MILNREDPTPSTPFLRSDCDGSCRNDPNSLVAITGKPQARSVWLHSHGHSHHHHHSHSRAGSRASRSVTPLEKATPAAPVSATNSLIKRRTSQQTPVVKKAPSSNAVSAASDTSESQYYNYYPLGEEYEEELHSRCRQSPSSIDTRNDSRMSTKDWSRVNMILTDSPERTNYTYAYGSAYRTGQKDVYRPPKLSRRGIHSETVFKPITDNLPWEWNIWKQMASYFSSTSRSSSDITHTPQRSPEPSISGNRVSFREEISEFIEEDTDSGLDSAASGTEDTVTLSDSVVSRSQRHSRSRSTFNGLAQVARTLITCIVTLVYLASWPFRKGYGKGIMIFSWLVGVLTRKPDLTNAYELRSRTVVKKFGETTTTATTNGGTYITEESESEPVVIERAKPVAAGASWCCWWPLLLLLALLLTTALLVAVVGRDETEQAVRQKLVPALHNSWTQTRVAFGRGGDYARSMWLLAGRRASKASDYASVLYADKAAAARHNAAWFFGGGWRWLCAGADSVWQPVQRVAVAGANRAAYMASFSWFVWPALPVVTHKEDTVRVVPPVVNSVDHSAELFAALAETNRRLAALEAHDWTQYVTHKQLHTVLTERLLILSQLETRLGHVQETVAAASAHSLTVTDSIVGDIKLNQHSLSALEAKIADLLQTQAELAVSVGALGAGTAGSSAPQLNIDAEALQPLEQKLAALAATVAALSTASTAQSSSDQYKADIETLHAQAGQLSATVTELVQSVAAVKSEHTHTADALAALTLSVQALGAKTGCSDCNKGASLDASAIRSLIGDALALYDADKTGLPDHALESSGGSVLSTRCSETYKSQTRKESIYNIPLWYVNVSPRITIQRKTHSLQPGDCWAVKGAKAYLVLQLSGYVNISHITYEHIPLSLAPDGNLESAPKHFELWALREENDMEGQLLGAFNYNDAGPAVQTFPVQKPDFGPVQVVEIKVDSNHGHPIYTCMYRWRIHGKRVLPAYGRQRPTD